VKRPFAYVALFVVLLTVICSALDYAVTAGLRRSEMPLYAEWNAIVSGEAGAEVLIQGSSRTWVGFSPAIIGDRLGLSCYNLGMDGYPLDMELARYRLYRKYAQKPKIIVQALDTYSLNRRDDLYQNNQFLPYLNEDAIREGVEPYDYFAWYDYSLPLVRYRGSFELVCKGVGEFFGIRHYTNEKDRGYQGQARGWSDEFERWAKEHPHGVEQKYLQSVVDDLDSFLAECSRDGIIVVLVYPPEYSEARDMVNNREEIFTIYRRLAAKYQLEFLDYSYDAMANDTAYFYNSQHLNKLGSELFSARFADSLAGLLALKGDSAAGRP